MKLLSVTVPCYNSQDYMRHCIETLVPGGDEVEILIIDDGSTDGTAAIADQLQKQYPTIVRAIHQENAGHGGGVMKGLSLATGLYFKVVDSDDWVDPQVLKDLLALLRRFQETGEEVDMVVSDFVYDKVGARHKKVMRYPHALPTGRVLHWEEVGQFPQGPLPADALGDLPYPNAAGKRHWTCPTTPSMWTTCLSMCPWPR